MSLCVVRVALLLLLPTFGTPALNCIDANGKLKKGFVVDNEECVASSSSVFFYAIRSGPISSNGLQAGAATDLHLWFGSRGNPKKAAFDPQNFGLSIPGDGGRLVIDLSPHFIYNTAESLDPVPNSRVELGLGQGNALLGNPCNFQGPRGAVVCAGWTATFGESTSQIVYSPQDSSGLTGDRGTQVGVKFAHIHPNVQDKKPIYYNALGVCSDDSSVFCREEADCGGSTCKTTSSRASITATVLDGQNNVISKAIQEVSFEERPSYHIFATNFGLFVYKELAEVVDFQHVQPGTKCENVNLVEELFSKNAPYAPRFVIFGPQASDLTFPHPKVPNLTIVPKNNKAAALKVDGKTLATIKLRSPKLVDDARIVKKSSNLGFISDGPKAIGGSIFAVPVKVGSSPGTYKVEVSINGNVVAVSNIVVDQPKNCSACAVSCGKNRVYTCRKDPKTGNFKTKCIRKATLRRRCDANRPDKCGRCP